MQLYSSSIKSKLLAVSLWMGSLLFATVSFSQNLVIKTTKASFQNRWTNEFLEFGGGSPILSTTNNNTWEVVPVPNIPECVYIKMTGNDLYLNTENGLGITAIQPGWLSAMWKLEAVTGTIYYRLINFWKKEALHNETRKPEVSAAGPGWLSAMWQIRLDETGTYNTSAPSSSGGNTSSLVTSSFSVGNGFFVVDKSDDGGTDPVIFGEISLHLLKNGTAIQDWLLFSRSASPGSRVISPERQQQPFYINQPAFTIDASEINLYSIRLDADLWDYDLSSSNDHLGKKSAVLGLSDVENDSKELAFYLTGEGTVKVAVTLFKGMEGRASLKQKILNSPQTDTRWVQLKYESVELSVGNHINGLAMDATHTFVNFPYFSSEKGDIYMCKTGESWSHITFNMDDKVAKSDRYPSGMQIAKNLLAVADNKYARFFYLNNETLTELPALKTLIKANAENVGIVYHPVLRCYFFVTSEQVFCSIIGEEPFVNGSANPNFGWVLLSQTGTIPFGEAGIALLYDEMNPNELLCLSLGNNIAINSYMYKATSIQLTFTGQSVTGANIGNFFLEKILTPPDGVDISGAGPSFRWGGTAMTKDGNVYIYAAPKRLDNVITNASNLIQWTIW